MKERQRVSKRGLPFREAIRSCETFREELQDRRDLVEDDTRNKMRHLAELTFWKVHELWAAGVVHRGRCSLRVRFALAEAATLCYACERYERQLDALKAVAKPVRLRKAKADSGIFLDEETSRIRWAIGRFLVVVKGL